MEIRLLALTSMLLLLSSERVHATDLLQIGDASQIKWQLNSQGHVYLRNLDSFDNTYLGCCYNYWIDTSTDVGKVFFSTLLVQAAARRPIWIGVPDKSLASAINYTGDW